MFGRKDYARFDFLVLWLIDSDGRVTKSGKIDYDIYLQELFIYLQYGNIIIIKINFK